MKTLIISLKTFLFFTILTGILYPLCITGIAQLIFPEKANGSLIIKNNKIIGSKLIGQEFDSLIYFSARPSVISYNPLPSGASNYGLTSVKLKELFDSRKKQFIKINQIDSLTVIPSEMLFASGSGLDPHISQKTVLLQVNRIVKARNFNENQKQKLLQCIEQLTEKPQYLCFGEERLNVLLLNLKIDEIK
ncbi:MAG: potassium-transporting ATPase subunit KdpC [Bacteroidetes bacterium]|nr:potassium-transporting ATPase subunit KdpC [Bacteroidota bacterium]